MKFHEKLVRFSILTGCIVVMLVAVVWRQNAILRQREKPIVSVTGEWQMAGKPVNFVVMKKEYIPVYSKFTASRAEGNVFVGYVSKNVFERIKPGQVVAIREMGEEFKGRISYIKAGPQEDTGLYEVGAAFDTVLPAEIRNPVCFAETKSFSATLRVHPDLAKYEDGRYFVWTIDGDGKARRKEIAVGAKDGYGLIVKSGLAEGDRLVTKGMTFLKEGDAVNILNK